MVLIRSIDVSPSMVNCSCAWASDYQQLSRLYHCPYTGAVVTRTTTLDGFEEDESHTVAFMKDSLSSLNSYGYSPHPLHKYLAWIREFLGEGPSPKPFIISITESSAERLSEMLVAIQQFRASNSTWRSRIAVEFNSSCPNIKDHPPPSYHLPSLKPYLDVFAKAFQDDSTLTIGLKLPPYIIATQFRDVIECISSYTRTDSDSPTNPIAYFTCTNTLGNSLVFADQTPTPDPEAKTGMSRFAVPPGLGGLAGEAIHSLSLGNVYTFSRLLAESDDPAMREIVIIGAGGVTSPEAVQRMNRAGAQIVGCATLLGKEGVKAFEILSRKLVNRFVVGKDYISTSVCPSTMVRCVSE